MILLWLIAILHIRITILQKNPKSSGEDKYNFYITPLLEIKAKSLIFSSTPTNASPSLKISKQKSNKNPLGNESGEHDEDEKYKEDKKLKNLKNQNRILALVEVNNIKNQSRI